MFRLFIWMAPAVAISLTIARFWLHPSGSGWLLDGVLVLAIVVTIGMGVSFLAGRASRDLDRSLHPDRTESDDQGDRTPRPDPKD